ncbi:polysaccharide deacetylase family protein [Solirubrobacter ginsenosidimutans]|uniref:Polysaccharide deacetylase family protein n=1 Tax=Solirubrobacter ginsenosidimutans TaxID=490573 RepID=A0A9X3N0G9_9ACTN|nr:polysaccharide deacetylase family protein [Solirubrobacter ginsenosidimutans]MDA0165957.1 polysaccharide deacetylase family protein [Solirubrobacter ginsenosidimutans]
MRASRFALAAGLFLLVPASPAFAAPDLTVSATHAAPTFLRTTAPNTTVYAGTLMLTVTNGGADPTDGTPVTVTERLPTGLGSLINNPGFGAGPTTASGTGWTCTGTTTSTCTRSDALAAGASYPPITVNVTVANNAAASLANAPTVNGGGDASLATGADTIPTAVDACPNGFAAGQNVTFGPPTPVIDSGVVNPERADGCSLLDIIWNAAPADHASFVAHVDDATTAFGLTAPQRTAVHDAANQSAIGTASDHQIDNACTAGRIALTFDDGPSLYRPHTMQNMRDRYSPAVLFDVAVRSEANLDIAKFERDEGHVVLSHTYDHPHLNALSPALQVAEMAKAEDTFNRLGIPITFRAMRPPFFEANAATLANLAAMGYTSNTARIETTDYDPANTLAATRDAIVNQLRAGAIILLHDGPIDTPAGLNSSDASVQIIDAARARGFCMGTLDRKGNVVATRYVPRTTPIPPITNAVPYVPLAYPGTPPSPWKLVPQPLKIMVAHTQLNRGGTGTITLTASNVSDEPTDGSTITLSDRVPTGLTVTSIAGTGWTCTGTTTRNCTRVDILPPHSSFPPVTINVSVSATANFVLANAPTLTGHGGNVWVDTVSDPISVGVGAPGDVGGSVPATLALTLGGPATFAPFTPGISKSYTASTTANVTTTAADATLTVADLSTDHPGYLINGAFVLPQPLQGLGVVKTYTGPVSNDAVPVTFTQPIAATDALRTGAYAKTLTFTLSTTNP